MHGENGTGGGRGKATEVILMNLINYLMMAGALPIPCSHAHAHEWQLPQVRTFTSGAVLVIIDSLQVYSLLKS